MPPPFYKPLCEGYRASHGFDPVYGASPLRRAIQRYIQDPLAGEILSGRFKEGSVITAEVKGKQIKFVE